MLAAVCFPYSPDSPPSHEHHRLRRLREGVSVVNLPAPLARVADEVRRQLRNMKLDRTVRRLPGNEVVALRDFLGPQADRILSRFGLIPEPVRRRRARRFEEDLRLLNDVLAGTAFGDRYWVW